MKAHVGNVMMITAGMRLFVMSAENVRKAETRTVEMFAMIAGIARKKNVMPRKFAVNAVNVKKKYLKR